MGAHCNLHCAVMVVVVVCIYMSRACVYVFFLCQLAHLVMCPTHNGCSLQLALCGGGCGGGGGGGSVYVCMCVSVCVYVCMCVCVCDVCVCVVLVLSCA